MRALGKKLLAELLAAEHCQKCQICGSPFVELHHVWIYAGRQINEVWAILGACKEHHEQVKTDPQVKEEFERRSLELATEEDLAKYPRKNWQQLKQYLERSNHPAASH